MICGALIEQGGTQNSSVWVIKPETRKKQLLYLVAIKGKGTDEEMVVSQSTASYEWEVAYQVVIPQKYWHGILSLAHETPMAGHLSIKKSCRKTLLLAWDTEEC